MKLSLIVFGVLYCAIFLNYKGESSDDGMTKTQGKALYKVDSIRGFYLIYARSRDTLYKIVSKKTLLENCNSIKVNQQYSFILHSRLVDRYNGTIRILSG